MRIKVVAVGRVRRDAHFELWAHYNRLIKSTGARLGISAFTLAEIDDRKPATARALLAHIPDRAHVVVLDERGTALGSRAFAGKLGAWRDQGIADLVFVIGGADGLDDVVQARADFTLAFGATTWPHKLVRVMLAEQIYRALCILGGHPYHRD